MSLSNIHTERLVLIPFTLPVAQALLKGNTGVLNDIGMQPTRYWPDQETMDTLPRIIKKLELVKEPTGFESWMVLLKHNSTVIGDAGFKGPPDRNGAVDIGYSIIEQEQQKGYGMETAKALIDWAFQQPDIKTITAKCLLENTPSARILEKLGMKEQIRDDEVIYWRLDKAKANNVFSAM